jgi:hypothetical protein
VLIENWVGQPYYERRYVGARRGIPFRFDATPAQPSSDSAPEASAASSL